MADDRIETEIVATTGQFQAGMKQAAEQAAESAAQIKEVLSSVGEAFGISLAIEGIKSFIESMGELGLKTERTMAQLGLSAEQVGLMGGAAQLAGTPIEAFTNGIERMSLNIQRSTRDAFNPAAQGLKNLGLSAQQLVGLPTDQYFLKLSEAVSKFNPSLNLTNNLMAVGGRGIAQMLPLLLEGREHFEEFMQAVKETGSALTDAQAKGFAQTHEQATLLSLTIQGLKNAAFDKLRPSITATIEQMREFIAGIRDSITEGGAWSYVLEGINYALKGLVTFLAGIAAMFRFLTAETQAFWNTTASNGEQTAAKLKADLDDLKKKFLDTFNAMWSVPTAVTVNKPGGGQNAPGIDLGGKDALAAQLKGYQDAIKADDGYYKSATAHIDSLFKLGQLTETQKTQALLLEVKQREQAELHWVDRELALGGLTVAQRKEIDGLKTQIVQKASEDRQKITDKAMEDEEKTWVSAADKISGAFTSQLRGLLQGTTSWAAAMKNVVSELFMSWVSSLAKFAAEWAAKQLFMVLVHKGAEQAKTAATTEGVAQRAAAESAGFLESIGKTIADALSSIGAAVAKIFAQLTAFLVPIFGPAAPAAALGLAIGVGATAAALIPKYELGTDFVPQTGLALLHQGEAVIPAGQNPFSGGGGGGGITFAPQINAIDGHSVARMMPVLAKAFQAYLRDNPSKKS